VNSLRVFLILSVIACPILMVNRLSSPTGLLNHYTLSVQTFGFTEMSQPLIGWLLDKNWDGRLVEGVRVYSEQAFTIAFTRLLVVTSFAFIGTFFYRKPSVSSR
jgi:hypothetical protein